MKGGETMVRVLKSIKNKKKFSGTVAYFLNQLILNKHFKNNGKDSLFNKIVFGKLQFLLERITTNCSPYMKIISSWITGQRVGRERRK